MRTFSLVVIGTFMLQTLAQEAPSIQWQRTYGGSESDGAMDIQPTADGGYIVAGNTSSSNGEVTSNHGMRDAWVLKLDAMGNNIEWQRSYGGTADDEATSIRQTPDGGYVFAGHTNSQNGDVSGTQGGFDAWVVKTGILGQLEWHRTLGGSGSDVAKRIELTADGGYIIAGNTLSADGDVIGQHGMRDGWIAKLDMTGNIQWQQCYGGSENDELTDMQKTSDGGYILVGITYSNDGDVSGQHGNGDMWVVKVGPVGSIQWQQVLGGSNSETAWGIQETSDGGYIAVGGTESNDGDVSGNQGWGNYWVVKLNASGELEWQKCYGGTFSDVAYDVIEAGTGGYVILGRAKSMDGQVTDNHGGPNGDAWLIRTDPMGNMLWERALGGSQTDQLRRVLPTPEGGYIMTGYTASNDGDVTGNKGLTDLWVVKLSPDNVGIGEQDASQAFSLFPNPATEAIYLHFNRLAPAGIRVQLHDAVGRCVGTPVVVKVPAGEYTLRYSTTELPPGTYELRLVAGGKSHVRKLVKR